MSPLKLDQKIGVRLVEDAMNSYDSRSILDKVYFFLNPKHGSCIVTEAGSQRQIRDIILCNLEVTNIQLALFASIGIKALISLIILLLTKSIQFTIKLLQSRPEADQQIERIRRTEKEMLRRGYNFRGY